jgi:hypothetical protein
LGVTKLELFHFDVSAKKDQLGQLPKELMVSFAAACTQRLAPGYFLYFRETGRGDMVLFSHMLYNLWSTLLGNTSSALMITKYINICISLIPKENNERWTPEQSLAESAATSLTYSYRCLQNADPQEAVWAASQCYELLDELTLNSENIDTNTSDGENRVLQHPIIQAELARQHRDLDELLKSKGMENKTMIETLRNRAQKDADIFFGNLIISTVRGKS